MESYTFHFIADGMTKTISYSTFRKRQRDEKNRTLRSSPKFTRTPLVDRSDRNVFVDVVSRRLRLIVYKMLLLRNVLCAQSGWVSRKKATKLVEYEQQQHLPRIFAVIR